MPLLFLAAVALLLRWPFPEFQWLHVDERAFVTVPLGFWGGDLNPHFFNYPTFHFYLVSALYLVYFLLFSHESFEGFLAYRYFVDAGELTTLARIVTTLFAVGTVIVTAQLARRIYGRTGAWVAGLVLAVLPLHVRFSHLAITDTPAAFWVALALLGSVRIIQEGRLRDYLLAGIAAGLAAATKYPGAIVLVAAVTAALMRESTLKSRGLWITLGSALVIFCATTPYVWLDYQSFWAEFSAMGRQHLLAGADNRQESALLHHLRYSAFYGLGLTVMASLLVAFVWRLRDWRREEAVLLIFICGFTAVLLAAGSVFMRYTLPILPALSPLLVRSFALFRRNRIVFVAWIGLLLIEPTYASWKIRSQLSGLDSRTEAQRWLYDRLSGGGRIAHLSNAAPIFTLSPNSVLERQRHFLNSFSMEQLIESYAVLASRSDLPPFFVSLPLEAFVKGLTRPEEKTTDAILFDYDHPLIDPGIRMEPGAKPTETVQFPVGEIASAAYDWGDLYFLPIGGSHELTSSGPAIRALVFPASITEPAPSSGDYFELLAALLRANKLVDEGDWGPATSAFQSIRESGYRMHELVSKANLYNLYLGLGMIHFRRGEMETALKHLRFAIHIHPTSAVAYFHQGEALRSLGRFESASESYRLALDRSHQDAKLLHNLGVGFMKMGRYGESIEILNRATVLKSEADIYVNLAVAYDRSGMIKKRNLAFRKALEIDPLHTQAEQIQSMLDSSLRDSAKR